jgi:hypothetical protein
MDAPTDEELIALFRQFFNDPYDCIGDISEAEIISHARTLLAKVRSNG